MMTSVWQKLTGKWIANGIKAIVVYCFDWNADVTDFPLAVNETFHEAPYNDYCSKVLNTSSHSTKKFLSRRGPKKPFTPLNFQLSPTSL